ncbi:MAG: hypothetical protein ABI233_09885 [Chthoniobacterales bacterium]
MRIAVGCYFLLLATALGARPEPAALANLLETAKSDYETGHFDSALAKLDKRDKARGPSAESLDLRGQIALEQGKLDLAAKGFDEAHKLAPQVFAPRLHAADVLLRAKKYDDAGQVYRRLVSETNILISNERVRYGLLITALAQHKTEAAKRTLANSNFPTETPAYYFAQAAMELSQGHASAAQKWMATARQIFDPKLFPWFARPLYDLGWLKDKLAPPAI